MSRSISIRTAITVLTLICLGLAIYALQQRLTSQSQEISRLQSLLDQTKGMQVHYGDWVHLQRPGKFLALCLYDDGDEHPNTADYVWIESSDVGRFGVIDTKAIERIVADLRKIVTSHDRKLIHVETPLGDIDIGFGRFDEGCGDYALPWGIRWSSNGNHRGFLYSPWSSAEPDVIQIFLDQSDSHEWPLPLENRWIDFS